MKHQRMVVMCPYCNIQVGLREAKDYSKQGHLMMDKKVWVCSKCGAWTMAKKKSEGYAPMGVLADDKTRSYRVRLHSMFDELWKSGKMTRHMAYLNLSLAMKKPQEKTHIGMFTYKECEQAEKVIAELLSIYKISCYNRK